MKTNIFALSTSFFYFKFKSPKKTKINGNGFHPLYNNNINKSNDFIIIIIVVIVKKKIYIILYLTILLLLLFCNFTLEPLFFPQATIGTEHKQTTQTAHQKKKKNTRQKKLNKQNSK